MKNFLRAHIVFISLLCSTQNRITQKFEKTFPAHWLAVGFAEAQGRRMTMEDAHCIDFNDQYAFFGIFDGHGGRKVADFVAQRLHKNVLELYTTDNDQQCYQDFGNSYIMHSNSMVRRALWNGFLKTHQDLDETEINACVAGCTAIVALIHNGVIYAANAGDSRAVLSNAGRAVALSSDHKPHRPDEKERIEKLGGRIITYGVPRVNGNLAVARAIGDKDLNSYVIPNPEIQKRIISIEDEFIILACDGVWDVLNNQAAVDIVRSVLHTNKNFTAAAHALKDKALRLGSTDNISVMIIGLHI